MMTCREYIFKLTSGQLDEAGRFESILAFQHRLICRRCRTFTYNNQKLNKLLKAYRTHLTRFIPESDGSGLSGSQKNKAPNAGPMGRKM